MPPPRSRSPGSRRPPRSLKVGVVYVSPIAEIGWTRQHSLGAEAIAAAFGDRVDVTALDNVYDPQSAERVFAELASTGNRLIFGTSFSHGTPMLKVAPRFPDVAFEHCSGLKHLDNLGTFEAKYYEGTYLAGIAAGHVTQSKKLGFIGGFPIPDIVGPGNAMLLGAQSVDPSITCHVIFLNSWYDPAKEKEATATLVSQGCDVICSMTDTATVCAGGGAEGRMVDRLRERHARLRADEEPHLLHARLEQHLRGRGAGRTRRTWKSEVRWQGVKEGVVTMSPWNNQALGRRARPACEGGSRRSGAAPCIPTRASFGTSRARSARRREAGCPTPISVASTGSSRAWSATSQVDPASSPSRSGPRMARAALDPQVEPDAALKVHQDRVSRCRRRFANSLWN